MSDEHNLSDATLSVMADCDLFQNFEEGSLIGLLPSFKEHKFKAAEELFHEGDESDELFIIIDGTVRVTKNVGEDEDTLVTKLGPSRLCGEMAFMSANVRTTTCSFEDKGLAVSLPRTVFEELKSESPEVYAQMLRNVGAVLSARLSSTTGELCEFISCARNAAKQQTVAAQELESCQQHIEKVVEALGSSQAIVEEE